MNDSFVKANSVMSEPDTEPPQVVEEEVAVPFLSRDAFKRLELSSWFMSRPETDDFADIMETWLEKGELRLWIAQNFFQGATVEKMSPELLKELEEYVEMICKWANIELPEFLPYRECPANPMTLLTTALPVRHRPFLLYCVANLIVPGLGGYYMRNYLGMRRHRAGGLLYWLRDDKKSAHISRSEGRRPLPIVFCHGLGVGYTPYLGFIRDLLGAVDTTVYVLELPWLAQEPWLNIPSAREVEEKMPKEIFQMRESKTSFRNPKF